MKAMIATKAMLQYPDHNLPFENYTNASDYQLDIVIMQMGSLLHTTHINSTLHRKTTL